MSSALRNRPPWPMKWIVVAIVVTVVPYTILTLHYRKPGPAFEPYEDIKNRANVSRLLSAGYQRIPIPAQRPADGSRTLSGAIVATIAGGLPTELRTTLVELPVLPTEILSVIAAPSTTQVQSYVIQLTCRLPNDQQQLGGAQLYIQGGEAVVLPTFEHLTDGLISRSREAAVLLTIPAGILKSGRYTMTVVGEQSSRSWPLEVK